MPEKMLMFRKLFLVAAALAFGSVASHDRLFQLEESCDEGETEMLYFNFSVELDIPDRCVGDDFEAIGRLIQDVIGDIEGAIPDYENEFIQADVCPAPSMLLKRSRARFLSTRRMVGLYIYSGAGTCKRCRTNKRVTGGTIQNRDRRTLFNQSVAERACAVAEAAENSFDIAEQSCEAANSTLEELSKILNSTKYIKPGDKKVSVEAAKNALLDCDIRKKKARSMATIVTEICKEVQRSVDEDEFESQLELEAVAAALNASTTTERLVAQNDFYKVKYELILSKMKTFKEKLDKRNGNLRVQEKNLKADLEATLSKLERDMKILDEKIKESTKNAYKEEVQELEGSVAERACAMAEAAENSFDIVESSYKAVEAKMEILLEILVNTTYIKPKDKTDFVEAAKNALLDSGIMKKKARSMATIVTEICEEVQRSVYEDEFESHLELETAANTLQASIKTAEHYAREDFYEVKAALIKAKAIITEAEHDKRKLKAVLEELLDKLKLDMRMSDEKIKEATKMGDKDEVQKLTKAKEGLEDAVLLMKDDLIAIENMDREELEHSYEVAMGTLQAEAANSMMDWFIAFAELIELLLPERLLDEYGLDDGGCITKEPTVKVEVVELKDKGDQFTEKDCDAEFVDSGMDGP